MSLLAISTTHDSSASMVRILLSRQSPCFVQFILRAEDIVVMPLVGVWLTRSP